MNTKGPLLVSMIATALAASITASGLVSAQATGKPSAIRASSETDARILAAQILSRWAPVAEAAGLNMSVWQEQFSTQLGSMPLRILQSLDAIAVAAESSPQADYEQFAQGFVMQS